MNQRTPLAVKQEVVARVACAIGLDLGDKWSRYCVLDAAGVMCAATPRHFKNGSSIGTQPVS